MIRAYRYVFYRLYRWNSRWDGGAIPQTNAFLLMVVFTWWNVHLLFAIVESSLGASLLPKLSKTEVVLGMAGLALPLYFLLLHRGKVKEITAEFEIESPQQRRVRGVMVFAYVVLSYLLLVVGAIVRSRALH